MNLEELNDIATTLRMMPDDRLASFANMHKDDPYVLALAVSESSQRRKMRAAAAAPVTGPMPTVADQAIAQMAPPETVGIGALPAPNMQSMAVGGIVGGEDDYDSAVGYAEGGVARFQEGGRSQFLRDVMSLPEKYAEWWQRQREEDARKAAVEKESAAKRQARLEAQGKASFANYLFGSPEREAQGKAELAAIDAAAPSNTPPSSAYTPSIEGMLDPTSGRAPAAPSGATAASPKPPAGTGAQQTPPARPAPAAPTGIAALDPMAMAKKFLPDQTQAAQEYADQETMAANAQMARMKELMQGDGTKAYEGLEKSIKKEEETAGAKLGEEKAMALFQAGLQIMGGTSPYAAVNIATGALKGLEGYKDAKKELDKAARERVKMLADIEQARRAEARDDRKTLLTLQERIDGRKEKVRDAVFSAGQSLGLKQGELAAGFARTQMQIESEAPLKAAQAGYFRSRAQAAGAADRERLRAMQEYSKIQNKLTDELRTDPMYATLQTPDQKAAYKTKRLNAEIAANPFLSGYLFTSRPAGTVRELGDEKD